MASTITLQQTANYILAFIVQRLIQGVAGIVNEPFLTTANYAMQTILQPPFRWEWNRKVVTTAFSTVVGQSDYVVALADFGWLEKAVINFATLPASGPSNFELQLYEVLAVDTTQNRPTNLAVLLDDGAGNITFRLQSAPDAVYNVDLVYQKSPILATTMGSTTWAPIPDKFQFLYTRFCMAQLQMMYNQQLGLSNLEVFFRQLVAAAEGLSEMEKAIFLEDSLRPIRQRQAELLETQQGRQARF